MAMFTPEQQEILSIIFTTLNTQLADLRDSLWRTRRELIALASLISRKGVEVDRAEWEAVSREIEVAHQVELALDPHVQRGQELIAKILRGEVDEGEVERWFRDTRGEGA
jgi:hypothetical protein